MTILRAVSDIKKSADSTVRESKVDQGLEEVWNDREAVKWEDGTTWVVSRNGLKKLKSISGRDQDLLDIQRLNEAEDES